MFLTVAEAKCQHALAIGEIDPLVVYYMRTQTTDADSLASVGDTVLLSDDAEG